MKVADTGKSFKVFRNFAIQIFDNFELKNMLNERSVDNQAALHFSTFNRDPEGFKIVANVSKLTFSNDEMKEMIADDRNLLLFALFGSIYERRQTIDALLDFVRSFKGSEFVVDLSHIVLVIPAKVSRLYLVCSSISLNLNKFKQN